MLTAIANSYSGGTTITAGTLQLGTNVVGSENAASLGAGSVSVSGGAVLHARPGSTGTTYNIANPITLNGGTFWQADGIQQLFSSVDHQMSSGGTLLSSWGNTGGPKYLEVTSIISGSSQLTIGNNGVGSGGVVEITNINTFSGTVDVSGNLGGAVTLQLTNSTAFANATVNADGGTFTYGPANMIFGALTGNGNFTVPTGALIVGGIGANTTYNGVMGGTGGLSLQGPGGSLTLTASQTFTGRLTVNGGTLNLPGIDATFNGLGGRRRSTWAGPASTLTSISPPPARMPDRFPVPAICTSAASAPLAGLSGRQHVRGQHDGQRRHADVGLHRQQQPEAGRQRRHAGYQQRRYGGLERRHVRRATGCHGLWRRRGPDRASVRLVALGTGQYLSHPRRAGELQRQQHCHHDHAQHQRHPRPAIHDCLAGLRDQFGRNRHHGDPCALHHRGELRHGQRAAVGQRQRGQPAARQYLDDPAPAGQANRSIWPATPAPTPFRPAACFLRAATTIPSAAVR